MSESNFLRQTLLSLSRVATVFRHNVGEAWAGRTGATGPGWVRLLNPFRITYGLTVGGSDIIGWIPVTIQPEHVGQSVAVFLAVETKGARTEVTDAQLNFLKRLAADGGIAVLAREGHDDAGRIIAEITTGQTLGGRVYGSVPGPRRQTKQPVPDLG